MTCHPSLQALAPTLARACQSSPAGAAAHFWHLLRVMGQVSDCLSRVTLAFYRKRAFETESVQRRCFGTASPRSRRQPQCWLAPTQSGPCPNQFRCALLPWSRALLAFFPRTTWVRSPCSSPSLLGDDHYVAQLASVSAPEVWSRTYHVKNMHELLQR